MGARPVYYVWPMPSYFIFESSDNWLNTHKADWRWPIIILLIDNDGQSRGQRALAGGVLDFTHQIQIPQCTLGFVKQNYCVLIPVPYLKCALTPVLYFKSVVTPVPLEFLQLYDRLSHILLLRFAHCTFQTHFIVPRQRSWGEGD